MITSVATHGAWKRLSTLVSASGATRSTDHANRLRVQIIAITNSSRKCHRKKLSAISTLRTVLPVMIPVKKLSTGSTGSPEPASLLSLRNTTELTNSLPTMS